MGLTSRRGELPARNPAFSRCSKIWAKLAVPIYRKEKVVIEGHVPAADIKRLLAERPAVAGLAVPGMPMGSPGMEGPRKESYQVISFDKEGQTAVFSRH
jgi:hypothetical protein